MTKRCLIVDDSDVIRTVASRILMRRGLLVNEADRATRALDLCRVDMPDLLIVDIKLPDMDSLEFLRTLRALPTPRRPFVGVLMVEFDLPTLLRCRRAGADAHLMKPFTAAQMNARLDEIEAERLAKAA
jgi:two-component system chemotaxis response regulator CheY